MKYLKRFNESIDKSNFDDIKENIKDILLPISDMGYEISVVYGGDFNGELTCLNIRVVRYTDPTLKMNDEVEDEFIRMKEYLELSGFNLVDVLYVREGDNYQFTEDFNDFIILEEVELKNLVFVAKVN